jgi:hypothetical protein
MYTIVYHKKGFESGICHISSSQHILVDFKNLRGLKCLFLGKTKAHIPCYLYLIVLFCPPMYISLVVGCDYNESIWYENPFRLRDNKVPLDHFLVTMSTIGIE